MNTPKKFCHFHRVTYSECTLGDHVYYGRYLDILEEARGEFFRSLGAPCRGLQEEETSFPVVECRLRYRSPARYDDLLTVELWLTAAAGARMNFAYRLLTKESLLVLEAETLHACANLEGKPKRLPPHLLSKLFVYLHTASPA